MWVRFEVAVAQDGGSSERVCRAIMSDITEQKLAEEQLKHYTVKLETANKALDASRYLAEAANRAKSEFLTTLSHEIRTPMTAVLGYLDIIADSLECCTKCSVQSTCEIRVENRQFMQATKRNGNHLLRVINDILEFSKIEAERIQIESKRCSPIQVLDEVVSLIRPQANAKHLKLETDLAGPLPETILTDPLQLRQILINLLGNAIKFTEQGEVRLAVRMVPGKGTVPFSSDENRDSPPVAPFSSDESRDSPPVVPFSSDEKLGQSPDLRLCFDVTDTGIGMSGEEIGKLFKPFTQVDGSNTRKFGGLGLGLCISKRLAEALGGNIEVRSEPGQGSTFSVTIDPGPLDGIRMI